MAPAWREVMRRLWLALVAVAGCLPDNAPLHRTGDCAEWPHFVPLLPSENALELSRLFVPLGKRVTRSVVVSGSPCSDPSQVSVSLEVDAGAAVKLLRAGADDGGTFAASFEIEALVPGPVDVQVDFGDAVARGRWFAVEERPKLEVDGSALLVSRDGTIRVGTRMVQVPARALAIGRVVWSHGDRLESFVVDERGDIASRGVFELDGGWSISSARENVVVAVRPGGAVEIAFEDGGYRATTIDVDSTAQDPLAWVNGRWVRYRQAVPVRPSGFVTAFTGGRICELDGGCTTGSFYITEVRPDGLVVVPPSLDRYELRDGVGPPKATLEFPLIAQAPLLQPLQGAEGEGSPVIGNGYVLVPEFSGTPRLLFFPTPNGANLFMPTLTRDWFEDQGTGYRRNP